MSNNHPESPLVHDVKLIADSIASAQKLPDSKYIEADISDEVWREVELSGGIKYRIDNPVRLIIRKGGSTHRVVDATGVVHCYAAPETGNSIIRWYTGKSNPVKF
jgi:hypothetical protein